VERETLESLLRRIEKGALTPRDARALLRRPAIDQLRAEARAAHLDPLREAISSQQPEEVRELCISIARNLEDRRLTDAAKTALQSPIGASMRVTVVLYLASKGAMPQDEWERQLSVLGRHEHGVLSAVRTFYSVEDNSKLVAVVSERRESRQFAYNEPFYQFLLSLVAGSWKRQFQWRVSVLDDEPLVDAVTQTLDALDKTRISCRAFGHDQESRVSLDFLNDSVASDFIASSHIILVDMRWVITAGLEVAEWDAFREKPWSDDDVRTQFPRHFLNAPVADDERGYWIAAAVSRVAPSALITFFSQRKVVLQGTVALAMSKFAKPPFLVQPKEPARVATELASGPIAELQRQLVAANAELLAWVIGKVAIPCLLGRPPEEGKCGKLWPTDPADVDWVLEAECFFPQWDGTDVNGLLTLALGVIPKESYRVPAPRVRALNSIEHDLKKVCASGRPDRGLLERAIGTCFEAGACAEGVLLKLREADRTDSTSLVFDALADCGAIRENSLRQLDDYCNAYGNSSSRWKAGALTCAVSLSRPPALDGAQDTALPFDLAHLRRAVEALSINRPEARFSVNAEWDGQVLTVTYADSSEGFVDVGALGAAVVESLREKGLNRGLPLALSFPFYYAVRFVDVLLGVSGSKIWHRLFPANEACPGSQNSVDGYGVRWSFALTVPAARAGGLS
jgi:hypothetical protein